VICIAGHASDGLELSTGRVGVDGNLSSLIDLAPDCLVLASGSISEGGLSVSEVSLPSLEATMPFAGGETDLAFDDVNIPSAADSLLIEKHSKSASNLLNHPKVLAASPSVLKIPCHVSDFTENTSFETETRESTIHLGHVNYFADVPRSILQVLCKEFNIKANTKNIEMRQALSFRAQSDNQILMALQEALKSNYLTKRVKTKTLNQGGVMLSARRTNTDEDILSKAQRLAAKCNLEISESSFLLIRK
jgi:hypothetical protein